MIRGQKLILGSLGLVTIVLFIALLYVLLTRPSGTEVPLPLPQKVYSAPVAAVTARSAYALAQQVALAWREDAFLVGASASWRKATLGTFREPVPWAFQFYSASVGRLYLVSVSGGEARALRESFSPYDLSAITDETWQVDSPQALAEWLNAGGGRFLRSHTLIDVHAALRYDKARGKVMWSVTGLEIGGDNSFPHSVEAGP